MTALTIKYLRKRTLRSFRLILVDNATKDTTPYSGMLRRGWDTYIRLSENRGLEVAKNIGLEKVKSEKFIDTDNDILVPKLDPCWLDQLNALMTMQPEFAAVALRPQILVGVGPIFNSLQNIVENNVVGGSMRMMNTKAVRDAGGWSDVLMENRKEEWEICGKLKAKGFKVGFARELFCYHMFGEDHNWGYGEGDNYHGKPRCDYVDSAFEVDEETLVPKFKHNQ
ncbi:MAG: hypothetical protein JRL30_28695 [Deltaproteobacteria bacterium]|nr:hypothetical protein [Deltaproteobacteria bacterium]